MKELFKIVILENNHALTHALPAQHVKILLEVHPISAECIHKRFWNGILQEDFVVCWINNITVCIIHNKTDEGERVSIVVEKQVRMRAVVEI